MDMVTLLELRKDGDEGPIAAMPPSLTSLPTGFLPSELYSDCWAYDGREPGGPPLREACVQLPGEGTPPVCRRRTKRKGGGTG